MAPYARPTLREATLDEVLNSKIGGDSVGHQYVVAKQLWDAAQQTAAPRHAAQKVTADHIGTLHEFATLLAETHGLPLQDSLRIVENYDPAERQSAPGTRAQLTLHRTGVADKAAILSYSNANQNPAATYGLSSRGALKLALASGLILGALATCRGVQQHESSAKPVQEVPALQYANTSERA